MKNKNKNTSSKIQQKIAERNKFDTSNIQIHDFSLSCLGTGTSIKSGEVNEPKPSNQMFVYMQGYAGSEQVLGRALQGRRQNVVIATKFGFREGPFTPPYSNVQIDEAVTRNLTKLQTSYVDLLQVMLHNLIQEFTQHQLLSGYKMAVAQCILVNQRIYYCKTHSAQFNLI